MGDKGGINSYKSYKLKAEDLTRPWAIGPAKFEGGCQNSRHPDLRRALRRSQTGANGSLRADPVDPADPGMNSRSVKNISNSLVFDDFGQALDKYTPIVTGIRQIYAESDRNWTDIPR